MTPRRRALVRSLLFWIVVGVAGWLDAHAPVRTIEVQGAFVGAIISGIVAAFAFIADKAVTIAVTIAQAAVMIGIAIAHFAVAVGGVFVQGFQLLQRLWSNVLRPFATWTWDVLDKTARWLKTTFAPVIKFLDRVRREFDALYEKWLRPLLDTIEVLRRTLQLLERLHIEWAAKLDEKLAELEDRLLAPVREIRRYLNEAINLVNSVVDGFGLFKRIALLRSTWEHVGGMWNALLGHSLEDVDPSKTAAIRAEPYPRRIVQGLGAAIVQYERTGGGDVAPIVEAAYLAMRG